MSAKMCFVTATDTDSGKTFVSTLLLQGLKQLDGVAVGVKPVAAGADDEGKNGDALLLQGASGIALPYLQVNPICYQAPVAPHLAAVIEQLPLNEEVLDNALAKWRTLAAEHVIIEGAGGWLLPIGAKRYLSDWVSKHQLPVVLVVGVKLGCLNHAMLTVREIERSGCKLLGWVANCVAPDMLLLNENIADLKLRISAPCLGVVPFDPKQDEKQQLAQQLAHQLLRFS